MGAFTNKRRIVCENSYGYKLEFAYSFPFFLSDLDGIHDYSGNVASIQSAFGVGVSYVGTSINSRNIKLVIAIRDDDMLQIRRDQIHNIFPLKDRGTFYYYEGDLERKINYYVESVEPTRNTNIVYFSISLICPSPYFMDSTETIATLHNWDKRLTFPLQIPEGIGIEFGSKNESTAIEIENNSHIDYGLTISFEANGTVENPSLKNTYNGDEMKLNYTMEIGDRIIITTYNNEKTITLINTQGIEEDITNSLVFGTKFLQAVNGSNRFISNADSGLSNLDVSISYYNYYEAI